MTTFSDPNFSTSSYASFRPVYPETLYTDYLLPYHRGARNTLLDLGCGPGIVIRPLSRYFTKSIGTDPSAGMLKTARSLTPPDQYPSVTYETASAEKIPFLKDGEVDMVVAAQAVHWFSHDAWWKEMSRVVRRGGTVAVWGYKDPIFPEHPKATRALKEYMRDEDKLGPCWSQPGRSIVEDRLRSVRPPEDGWQDVERWEYEPGFTVSAEEAELKLLKPVEGDDGKPGFGRLVKNEKGGVGGEGMLKKKMKVKDAEEYVRTWSAAHTWVERHPEVKRGVGEGDLIDRMFREMKEVEGWGDDWRDMEIEVEWGHAVVSARKK